MKPTGVPETAPTSETRATAAPTAGVHRDVTDLVVANDLCIGCGVCAAACPSRLLTMNWSAQGELVPARSADCPPKCNLCLLVCPFTGMGPDQDVIAAARFGGIPGIQRRDDIGHFLNCQVGHASDSSVRMRAASGGTLRVLLRTLLEKDMVDRVVCVTSGPATSSADLFRFGIVDDGAAIDALPSSTYYPVEISSALRAIFEESEDHRYLIVGLPCVLHAVQLAMAKMPRLRRRIRFTAALVCGQLPNRFYTEFLAKSAGAQPDQPRSVSYRSKTDSTRASNFAFVAARSDGAPTRPVWWVGGARRLWAASYFKHNACNFCDDVFGEVADVSLMDAWLPRYMGDPKGHSLVVIRSPEIQSAYGAMAENGQVAMESIAADEVAASQSTVLEKKKWLIRGHLYAAQRAGCWAPTRRLAPSSQVWRQAWGTIFLSRQVMKASKALWPRVREAASASALFRAMWPLELLLTGQRIGQRAKYFVRAQMSRLGL